LSGRLRTTLFKNPVGRAAYQYQRRVADDVFSALDAAIADLKSGLVHSELIRGNGEILGDFAVTARGALEQRSPETDKVERC